MLRKKIISLGLAGLLSASLLVGCGSEFDSTEYLNEDGKKLIEKYEDREKYDYIKVESLEPFVSEDMYKDKYIMITGKVTDIKEEGQACYEISFDFEENHTIDFIRVFINKNMIDVKFNKGDTITVYGKCNGIQTKRYDDKSFDYWHINAYFLELGDTTDKEKNVKKDDVEAKATEEKEVTKDKEEKKAPSQDNKESSSEKQVNTKKDNTNVTVKKDTNQKETKSTKEVIQKKSNKNTTKEEPVYNEYGYDQYGNYDPNKDLYNDREWNDEDYERWDDIHDEEPIQEDDNIDEETGLAKIKDGTHLGEEAERQDMEGIEMNQ